MDAIRTAATLLVGTGVAAALLLAARRQRAAELTVAVQRKAAADTAHDAATRRITELYLKAVEQLGSDKAAERQRDVAVAWQRASGGDWATYAAEVSRRTTSQRT